MYVNVSYRREGRDFASEERVGRELTVHMYEC